MLLCKNVTIRNVSGNIIQIFQILINNLALNDNDRRYTLNCTKMFFFYGNHDSPQFPIFCGSWLFFSLCWGPRPPFHHSFTQDRQVDNTLYYPISLASRMFFYVLRPFRIWEIMYLHNFLFRVTLSSFSKCNINST